MAAAEVDTLEVLKTALAVPRERDRLFRLETELTRLIDSPDLERLDLKPMSADNRRIVEALSNYFGFRVVLSSSDAPHAEQMLPMALCKCPDTRRPAASLAQLVPQKAPPTQKVQVLRREKCAAGEKAPPVERLSLEEEEARLRRKQQDYEAARSRIFGASETAAADAPSPP
eukprot:CAMPEP_0195578838 /NCGR_PEP_ID=MMETSP0814-20130614/12528_1 /TAXON_ID=97485 /ORGANISM="Prymnesium parvum, Strain Texoma1" /LENGTH=171 /DNA_ID=CAMNT_0040715415 /DNA_START=38 /DNA_END=549 /DNA_ORIENTATION=-